VKTDLPEHRWEFEGDKRTWTQYGAAINKELVEALSAGNTQVIIGSTTIYFLSTAIKCDDQMAETDIEEMLIRYSNII